MDSPDFYTVLGVTPQSTNEEIRSAFKSLATQFHPDRNPTAEAERQFRVINSAYITLTDPQKRFQYDQDRWYQRLKATAQEYRTDTAHYEANDEMEIDEQPFSVDRARANRRTAPRNYHEGVAADWFVDQPIGSDELLSELSSSAERTYSRVCSILVMLHYLLLWFLAESFRTDYLTSRIFVGVLNTCFWGSLALGGVLIWRARSISENEIAGNRPYAAQYCTPLTVSLVGWLILLSMPLTIQNVLKSTIPLENQVMRTNFDVGD